MSPTESISSMETARRLRRVRDAMRTYGVDLLLVAPSADLRYLIGYPAHASERPTLLVLQQDAAPLILVPGFEAARVPEVEGLRIVPWEEIDDPFRSLREVLSASRPAVAAVADRTWASVLLGLQCVFDRTRFISAGPLLRLLRMSKSPSEVETLTRAAWAADAVFEQITEQAFTGRTERDLADELQRLLREAGLTDVWASVGSGPNSASPHHIVSSRPLQLGDAVVLDFGGAFDGYQSDITRTVHVGEPHSRFRHVYDLVRAAQEAAVRAVAPGVQCSAIDETARGVIDAGGYGDFFTHRTGHGIGLDVHEEPYIISDNDLPLEPGMTFSIEPGVYLPDRLGVRIEDIVVVTSSGGERLNRTDRALRLVA